MANAYQLLFTHMIDGSAKSSTSAGDGALRSSGWLQDWVNKHTKAYNGSKRDKVMMKAGKTIENSVFDLKVLILTHRQSTSYTEEYNATVANNGHKRSMRLTITDLILGAHFQHSLSIQKELILKVGAVHKQCSVGTILGRRF